MAAAGLTLRDDSILVQAGEHASSTPTWRRPSGRSAVVLESEHYGGSKNKKAWATARYLDAVEEYHASYATVHWYPREFLRSAGRSSTDQSAAGYRLQLLEASWPAEVAATTLAAGYRWRNAGWRRAAGGYPAITLRTRRGIAGVFVDESFDVRTRPQVRREGRGGRARVKGIAQASSRWPVSRCRRRTF